MGRPRTPTNVLELRGSFKKDPQRARPDEPKSEQPLGDAPRRLTVEEVAAWNEIVEQCCPGVLTFADRQTVELTARLLAELWHVGRSFDNARIARLQSLLGSLGMNPADRSKVKVAPQKKLNRFAGLGG